MVMIPRLWRPVRPGTGPRSLARASHGLLHPDHPAGLWLAFVIFHRTGIQMCGLEGDMWGIEPAFGVFGQFLFGSQIATKILIWFFNLSPFFKGVFFYLRFSVLNSEGFFFFGAVVRVPLSYLVRAHPSSAPPWWPYLFTDSNRGTGRRAAACRPLVPQKPVARTQGQHWSNPLSPIQRPPSTDSPCPHKSPPPGPPKPKSKQASLEDCMAHRHINQGDFPITCAPPPPHAALTQFSTQISPAACFGLFQRNNPILFVWVVTSPSHSCVSTLTYGHSEQNTSTTGSAGGRRERRMGHHPISGQSSRSKYRVSSTSPGCCGLCIIQHGGCGKASAPGTIQWTGMEANFYGHGSGYCISKCVVGTKVLFEKMSWKSKII